MSNNNLNEIAFWGLVITLVAIIIVVHMGINLYKFEKCLEAGGNFYRSSCVLSAR